MRIRKNAKLSPLLFSSTSSSPRSGGGSSVPAEPFQSHVCQLNQSPWDVIPFDSVSIQFQRHDDTFTLTNGNNADSVAALDNSVSSKAPKMNDTKNSSTCKREAVKEDCDKKAAARRAKSRAAKKNHNHHPPPPSSNPYEFYYYSGFGPLWGKRRGDRNNGEPNKNNINMNSVMEEESENNNNTAEDNNNNNVVVGGSCSSKMEIVDEELDYVDDDYDEEDEDDSGKKRMRKPVKARSLKSLM